MTNDELNVAIAVEIFGWRPELAWTFTTGQWLHGSQAGRLSAATTTLKKKVDELGLVVEADPRDGEAYCRESLEVYRRVTT